MAIKAKNIIVGGENKSPPQKEEKVIVKPEPITFKEIVRELPVIENKSEDKPHYHEIHDGDLHKMINKKSSYLTDMINLDK